jgi:hypothetical protein
MLKRGLIMYQNLEQRMVHTYIDMLPPFVPCKDAVASTESQEELYLFLNNMYQTLFEQPELMFSTINEDDAYPNRYNRSSYGKPSLYNHMKSDLKKLETWMQFLFELGSKIDHNYPVISVSGIKISKSQKGLLEKLGFELMDNRLTNPSYPMMFDAWRWMSNREGADMITFSRAMFDQTYSYREDIYARLFGDEDIFNKLRDYLIKNGYRCYEAVRESNNLDYSMEHAKQPTPLGSPLFGDSNHTGVSFDYRMDTQVPQYMVLRILRMKELLLHYEEMSSVLKEFVWKYGKHCDNCNYCTQTDKTGKRQTVAIEINSPWGTGRLCPLFPGFNFTFEKLDDLLYTRITQFLEFMDRTMSTLL